jgi:hypothetical protein
MMELQSVTFTPGRAPAPTPRQVAEEPATPEEAARRLTICASCEYFDSSKTMCRLCRCGLVARAGALSKHCPIQKW